MSAVHSDDEIPPGTRAASPERQARFEEVSGTPRASQSYIRRPLDLRALDTTSPPPRQWAVEYWLGMGHVTLLAGRGGIGKSLLAQQIASNIALGRDFIDRTMTPHNVLFWSAEDEPEELARRQIEISKAMSVMPGELDGKLFIESYHDRDCTLVAADYGEIRATGMVKELRDQVHDYDAGVVILDNISRLFAGNENSRHEVTQFIAHLNGATSGRRAAVLLLGHVGKGAGSEYSGNTAWENAVRSRLWFSDTKPDQVVDEDAAEEAQTDVRYLARRKANYGARDLRSMRYADGVFVVDAYDGASNGNVVDSIRRRNAEKVVLEGLTALETLNFTPSDLPSRNYAPSLLMKQGLADGYSKKDLDRAIARLVGDGRIERKIERGNNRHVQRVHLVVKQA